MLYLLFFLNSLLLAIAIDLLIGDPESKFHPVMLIGKIIYFLKEHLYTKYNKIDRIMGILTLIITFLIILNMIIIINYVVIVLFAKITLFLDNKQITNYFLISYWLLSFIYAFLLKWSFAIRNLKDVSNPIRNALKKDNIEYAREKLSWIVRRPTSNLDKEHVISATVEVIAESSTDAAIGVFSFYSIGVVLFSYIIHKCLDVNIQQEFITFNSRNLLSDPIMFAIISKDTSTSAFIFSIPIIFAYLFRIINTADSVMGYKDKKHRYLGWFAAKMDDFANYIPARLTAFLTIIIGMILHLDWKNASHILKVQAKKMESLNAGWTMGVVAGLLGVQFEKLGAYKLGVKKRPLKCSDIDLTYKIVFLSTTIFALISAILSMFIGYFILIN